ncbi:MAG: hypothetical protein IJ037_08700 [Clostridia bacterium]|nr:hypothetical protein [Clostridia bacterium]
MKKLRLCAAVLACLAAMSVSVHASEPGTAAEIAIDGMVPLAVTSALSDPNIPCGVLFDESADTGVEVRTDAFTVNTAHRVRDYLDAVAVQMNDGDDIPENTLVEVAVYGTNDEETLGWTKLDVTAVTEAENGFYVFDIDCGKTKYAFHRVAFTALSGDGFTVTEISLFKTDRGGPEYRYDLGDSIEAGEIPKLVPVFEVPERRVPAFSPIPWMMSRTKNA